MSLITTSTTTEHSLDVSLARTSPTSPRSPAIRWDLTVDHAPSSSSEKRRRSTQYPPVSASSSHKPSRNYSSPIFTAEASGRLCAQYVTNALGSLLEETKPDFPPLEQFIAQLIHRTYLPFFVIPSTLILFKRLSKCFAKSKETCLFDPHRLFTGLFIAAARAQCKSNSNVHNLRYWSAISEFSMKDISSIACMYPVLTGRDVIINGDEVEDMTERLLRMSLGKDCSTSLRRAVRKKLASFFTLNTVKRLYLNRV